LVFSGSALAADAKSITLDLGPAAGDGYVVITSHDEYIGMKLPAKLIDGRLYLRGSNSVGLADLWHVDKDARNETLIINEENPVEVHLGAAPEILFEGAEVTLDEGTKALLAKGLFPVRQVYELAGYSVDYDGSTHTVTLSR
jgi:hypothetical protein